MSGRPANPAATAAGFGAVLLWSTTLGVTRSLAETVGPLTAGAGTFLISGAVACGFLAARGRLVALVRRLAPAYLFGCGALFVGYMVCLYLAIGMAASRQQTLVVGLINYLWPSLTVAFSVPILGIKARWYLAAGLLAALAGTPLAVLGSQSDHGADLWESLGGSAPAYALALGAAVSWALYSNLARLWGARGSSAVPLFMLASGLALTALRVAFPERSVWTPRAAAELAFTALLPGLAAYAFWDLGMRKGNAARVAAFSLLTPLLSTFASALYLRVRPAATLWAGCILIVLAATVCERATASSQSSPADDGARLTHRKP